MPAGGTASTGFDLANEGLGPNNFIVKRAFDVLAVSNSVIVVPIATLNRFPFLAGVIYAVPGIAKTYPAMPQRE